MKSSLFLIGSSCLVAGAEWPQDVVRTLHVPPESSRESLVELLNTVDSGARMHHQHATASLDRRRFWGNNKDPCQASGSPDTTNDDCSSTRWNLMSNFAPMYANLKRSDRKLVLTEYEAEGLLDKVFNQLKINTQVIAGSDGSLGKPSKTNGLVYEASLMSNASQQLQGAALASMSVLYDNLQKVSQNAINGSNALKQNLATALGDLLSQVKTASSNQTVRANKNAQTMVGQANAAMNASMSAVQGQQQASANSIQAISGANDKAEAGFSKSAKSVKATLSDASDSIEGLDSSVQNKVEKTSGVLSAKIGAAVDAINSASDSSADSVVSQGSQIAGTLKSQTNAQLSDAQDNWSEAAQQASVEAENLAQKANSKLDQTAQIVQNSLSNATSSATGLIQTTQGSISEQSNAAIRTAKDTSEAASGLGSQVSSQAQAVQTQTNQLQSDVTAEQAKSQSELASLTNSASSASSEMMKKVVESVAQTQSDANSQNEAAAAKMQGAVANKLSGLGSDTSKVAGLLGSLQTGIAAGQSATGQALQASFAGTDSQADKAGSQLTNQLDSVGSSLTDAENKLRAGASSVAGSVEGSLNSGSSSAMQGLSSLERTNAKTQSNLAESVLKNAEKATDQSVSMSNSAHGLMDALDSLETGSTTEALSSTQDSVDAATAALFGSVGDADDETLARIAQQAADQKNSLNLFGSQFAAQQGSELSAYWASVASQLDQRKQASDQTALDAETSESATMSEAEQLKKIASMMAGNVDELEGENEHQSDDAHQTFLNRLTQLGGEESATLSALSAQLQGYQGDAMQGIGTYLHGLIGKENSQIGDSVSQQQAELDAMQGTSSQVLSQSARLQAVLAALQSDSVSSRDFLARNVFGILDKTASGTKIFGDKIDAVSASLNEVKAASAASLSDLERSIDSEMLRIPMILTSGAAKLQNDFALASSDLQTNIIKLREKLATAETEEEREAAMQGLVVLNKLQAIQQGVAEADAKLRAQIEGGAQQGLVDSGNVQGAMASVLSAMSSINSEMNSARLTVQSESENLGRQTATLVNGMNVMVNSTSDQLAQVAAQSALESRFNLNLAQARNQVRMASAVGGVNKTLSTFTDNANQAIDDEGQVSDDIGRLKRTAADSRNALSARIEEVLKEVTSDAGKINSGAVEGQNDVLTRLALVRMAMANFLGLWNEFAANMDRKLARFHATDSDFIANMETELKHKLSNTEDNLHLTDSQIVALKQQVELGMSDQVEFENTFTSKISDLRSALRAFNDDRNVKTLLANSMLSEFENTEAQAHSTAMDNIKALIDKFDETVLGHASQVGVFSGPTSLLEREIQEVEAEARDELASIHRTPFL